MSRRKAQTPSKDALAESELVVHTGAIRRYLAGILRPDELEDATQTVLQRALENLSRFRGEGSLRGWLLGIARNVGLEVARARQRDAARAWKGTRGSDGVDELTEQDLLVGSGPDQEERLGRKEQQALALSALDGLGLDDKLALLVTYVDEVPGPEAAEILGVSFAAFRQRLSRARQSLAAKLGSMLAEGAPGSAQVLEQWRALLEPEARVPGDGGDAGTDSKSQG